MRIGVVVVALLCVGVCLVAPVSAQNASERMDNLTALYMVRASESLCGFQMTDEQRREVLKASQFLEEKLELSKEKAVELYMKVVQSLEAQKAGGLCSPNGEWAQAFKQTVQNFAQEQPGGSPNAPAAVTGGAGSAAPAPAPQTPAVQSRSTGMDAAKAILGNTVCGSRDGKEYADYYAPDGRIVALDGGEIENGRWTLEGDTICTDFPSEGKICFRVDVSGDTATFVERDGAGFRGTIVKGNPKNL